MPILRELEELLSGVGLTRWERLVGALADDAEAAADGPGEREVLRRIGRLFSGMSSLNDLVIQDRRGALPEQERLDILRDRLYEAVADSHGP